jgi:hypothetical protein
MGMLKIRGEMLNIRGEIAHLKAHRSHKYVNNVEDYDLDAT